jgi:hypothetical protein
MPYKINILSGVVWELYRVDGGSRQMIIHNTEEVKAQAIAIVQTPPAHQPVLLVEPPNGRRANPH